jgi:hypothetical protein
MKKTIGIVAMSLSCLYMNAQQTWDAKKNPTVDSISSPYEAKLLPSRPALTTAQIFPVLGKYESAAHPDIAQVSITLDETNKGIVWVEGLPQGKIKAFLRQSPATYKVPAQQTESGTAVAEGTMIYDKETNTLRVCIGRAYNNAEPALAFAPVPEEPAAAPKVVKGKPVKTTKAPTPAVWMYEGTRMESATAMNQ